MGHGTAGKVANTSKFSDSGKARNGTDHMYVYVLNDRIHEKVLSDAALALCVNA